ncbi:cadherin-like beta sandwich domain-containing protein [Paenibacillus sp. FA6]|uniref:cadherin-like beta sandwich domain-containing protein n=1 Tax=Paenibacillus sp. FA6 TaxID=3413029 RepID=UPI003F6600D2
MTRISRKLAVMVLIVLFTTGVIPGKFGAGIGGISAVAAAANIPSQDGIGNSGSIAANEVVGTTFTGYQDWPSGFTKGSADFVGGVYDGKSIWMIPYNANEILKVNPETGEMTGYSHWPAGFTKGSNAFAGGVYDGTNIWLVPYSANQIIKVNATTGVMTGYSNWPGGSRGSEQFIGGAFDGTHIWLTPYSGNRLIKVDITTGAMTSYNSWPSGTSLGSYPFYGSVFDGTSIWLIPNGADRLIKVDPETGEMSGLNNWPSGFTKSADAFRGGVFDGTNIWLIPYNATHLVKINTTTEDMTGYNGWPSGFTKGSGSFAGGVYDGTNIWLVPHSANMLIKVNAATGRMTGFNNWPRDFTKGSNAFMGGVYDGENVWMIPFVADRLMKFGDSSDLSGLRLSSGTLSPTFNAATTSYTASVGSDVTSIHITPTAADAEATMTVNGSAVASGQSTATVLNVGDNAITVQVTAKGGNTKKSYTVTVTRATYASADLSGLTLSEGTLSPAFSGATTSYAASVASVVTSVYVTTTTTDTEATMTVNGSVVASGQATATALNVGDNAITVQVTAKDGNTKKSYAVTVTRATYASADLSGLTLSAGTLSPTFNAATTSYTASVGSDVTSLDVRPTAVDAEATMTVNGSAVASGQATATALNVGDNAITVQVIAKDGNTKKSYTIIVTVTSSNGSSGTDGTSGNDLGSSSTTEPSGPGNPTNPTKPTQPIQPTPTPTQPVFNDKVDLAAVRSIVDRGNTAPDVSFTDVSPSSLSATVIQRSARMGIVSGFENGTFNPSANVTRAEFATMLTRAFGLTSVGSASFADAQGHWAGDAIGTLKDLGILTGYEDGTFRPNQSITRAELVVMLARLTNYVPSPTSPFSDVESNWAADAIGAFAAAGIVLGKAEGKFEPVAPASRAESVAIIVRMLDKLLAHG